MKKNAKVTTILVASTMLFCSFTPFVAEISANSTSVQNVSTEQDIKQVTPAQLQKYDQYVKVSGNQYVLDEGIYDVADKTTISAIREQIKFSNEQVSIHSENINSATKERVEKQKSVVTYSAARPAHEVRKYWWGVKHIFRTATAAKYQASQWQSAALKTALASIVPGVAVVGIPAAGYAELLSHDLSSYSDAHPKSKIYMDVNKWFTYSFGIWKD